MQGVRGAPARTVAPVVPQTAALAHTQRPLARVAAHPRDPLREALVQEERRPPLLIYYQVLLRPRNDPLDEVGVVGVVLLGAHRA